MYAGGQRDERSRGERSAWRERGKRDGDAKTGGG
jgi:hypothetical protein